MFLLLPTRFRQLMKLRLRSLCIRQTPLPRRLRLPRLPRTSRHKPAYVHRWQLHQPAV
jgi:hypothetical protein